MSPRSRWTRVLRCRVHHRARLSAGTAIAGHATSPRPAMRRFDPTPRDPLPRLTVEVTMATTQSPSGSASRAHRGWSIAWGIALIVIGILALLMPGIAALATALTLAYLLILAGIVEIIHAFHTRGRAGFGWKLAA